LSTTRDPQTLPGLNFALAFPIIQENFWKPLSIPVTGGEASPINDQLLLDSLTLTRKQNTSSRLDLEHRQYVLLQQVADSSIMLRNNEHKLQIMEEYLNSKGGTNDKGLRDSEDVAKYRKLLPGMRSLVVLMREMIGDQLDTLAQVNAELFVLSSAAPETHQQQADALAANGLSQEVDLSAEPLLIPYSIQKAAGDRPLSLVTLQHQELLPDRITFQSADSSVLHEQFTQGKLDAVYGDSDNKKTASSANAENRIHTTLLFNPNSDTLIFPVLRQVLTCLMTAPELWDELPANSRLQLEAIDSNIIDPTCSGDLPSRQSAMLSLLEKGGYTWQEDVDGVMVKGSLTDPRGKPVSPLTIETKGVASLPYDIAGIMSTSLEPLGIDLNLFEPPAEISGITPTGRLDPDMRINHWLDTGSREDAVCGLSSWLPQSTYPVTFQQEIFTRCDLEPIEIAPAPQPSPTPPVMMSGKAASDDMHNQLWMIDLFTTLVYENWQADVSARYHLDWLMPLQPVDYAGWLD